MCGTVCITEYRFQNNLNRWPDVSFHERQLNGYGATRKKIQRKPNHEKKKTLKGEEKKKATVLRAKDQQLTNIHARKDAIA